MESNKTDTDIGDKCNTNGDCSPTPKKQSFDLNNAKNIDDISTPSELKFDEEPDYEDPEVKEKKKDIEKCLENPDCVNLEQWQDFAKGKAGLISDDYRRKIWPLLVGVTQEELTEPPSLDELSTHIEYNQVVLDVNRSLKRFPPGIPYEQRVALQDQLTVLILRVIMKYPHLKYYQGYHDVAITLLLVCGDRASFPLLCRLSYGPGAPLAPFMQTTMQPTQHLLNYMLPVVSRADRKLAECLDKAQVGTMFALPWYLTWFGHSLNKYTDVVRLYDYFLCAPPLFPVYVTAAIVLYRADEVYNCECDMAMLHCLLSRLPDDLPFEDILVTAKQLYENNDPTDLEPEVAALERREEEQRRLDEERLKRRQLAARSRSGGSLAARIRRCMPAALRRLPVSRRAVLATATVLIGIYVYYRPELLFNREAQRRRDEERLKRRQLAARSRSGGSLAARIRRCMPAALRRLPVSRRAVLATATVLIGIYVYYRPELLFNR